MRPFPSTGTTRHLERPVSYLWCVLFLQVLTSMSRSGIAGGKHLPKARLQLLLAAVCLIFPRSSSFLLPSPRRPLHLLPRLATTSTSTYREYILPDPSNDDAREFVVPAIVETEHLEADLLPLPAAVHQYGGFSSMSKARKLIRRGQVFVNNKVQTCQDAVKEGDRIQIKPVEPLHNNKRRDGKSRSTKKVFVVYEDDDLAVIIKPAGKTSLRP